MIVVSDTSPITNLWQIGELDLLPQLFGKIIIPHEVYTELCALPAQKAYLEKLDWISIQKPLSDQLKQALLKELDAGEAEAISLAFELKADYLLIDEQLGRKVAERYGLKIVGIIGILIQAKTTGLIKTVKPYLENLRMKADFRINPSLFEQIIKTLGE